MDCKIRTLLVLHIDRQGWGCYDKTVKEYEKGQVLLIVVLVMIVALTVGLSIVSRTITSNRITTEEQNSEQAFSAAEAGLEQALSNNQATAGAFLNRATYTTTVRTVSGNDILLNNGAPILKDSASDVWLSQYPGNTSPWSGNLTVYWGNPSDTCTANEATNSRAALEVVLISGTRAVPRVTHYALDPCPARAANNRFESISGSSATIGGKTFAYSKVITILPASPGLLMRIVPLYASSPVAVRGSTALPAQGTLVESVGTADNTQRKIVSFRGYPSLPTELFPFILFSPK